MKHQVVLREQKNNDRYDCVHADCTCGWHGQTGTEKGASSLGVGHMSRHGVKDAKVEPLKKLVPKAVLKLVSPPQESVLEQMKRLLAQKKAEKETLDAGKIREVRTEGEDTKPVEAGGQEETTS